MTIEQAPSASPAPMRAGGRAAEAGLAFQAAVATWFAVHILVRAPVGSRFGINHQALPVAIRLETGESLDDIEVSQSDGGALHLQCKTRASLSSGSGAPLYKTVGQLARWVADAKAGDGLPDLNRNVALLAVRADAPRSLDDLESGCRSLDLGGSWAVTRLQRNQAERDALGVFEGIASPAWTAHRGGPPDDGDLTDLARIFRISRFTMDKGDSDWREVSQLLGRALYGSEVAGDAPLRDLEGVMRDLISSGAPADRDGLLRALRRRGHNDIGAPGFEADVARLRAVTKNELARLAIHGQLPLGRGASIARESDAPLIAAILAGSLLVIGEPGAGKTGSLIHAAATIADAGNTVIFLSLDRFPGVAIAADLASEIGLTHPLVDTLAAMPGGGRKILFIDALDAARGAPSEGVFATLIENVRQQLSEDWIVVASIRTFDLRNGRRFKQAFFGVAADSNHADSGLSAVRHFLVPRLSETDLATVGAASLELGTLLRSAPPKLSALLRNIFNLSLAAQLLADGTDVAAFHAIRTQLELINLYADARLTSTPLQQAAVATVTVMATRRRLSVRKVTIGHSALDAVIQSGVLTESGDLVSFVHHVLFDHIAGRFYLEWDDPDALLAQLAGDTTVALLLAPALRFAVEQLWRADNAGRTLSWKLITGIFQATSIDPVLGNVALRIVVENIEAEQDIAGLVALVVGSPAQPWLAPLATRLAFFSKIVSEPSRGLASQVAIAWGRLALALLTSGERALDHPARVLLHTLFDSCDFEDAAVQQIFGQAARLLLQLAWTPSLSLAGNSASAIRFVGKSFASAPAASRVLLDRILREPHFSQHADHEATWLAEQIVPITRVDPDFTIEIFAALYGQEINDNTASWFGGQRSRIMPLKSNRQQDFAHCRWHLGTAMGKVLAISPYHGTRALIAGLLGKCDVRGFGRGDAEQINLGATTIELRGYKYEPTPWDQEKAPGHNNEDDLLHHYVCFLRGCDTAAFEASVAAASCAYATASIWTRIFGIGSERPQEVGHLLWPLIERPDFFDNRCVCREAARFVAAAWPTQICEARMNFEAMATDENRFKSENDRLHWRSILVGILGAVPGNLLELDATKTLRVELESKDLLNAKQAFQSRTGYQADFNIDDFILKQMRNAGADVEAGPNREVFDASNALHALIEQTPADCQSIDLTVLWSAAIALLALIEAHPGLQDHVEQAAWGYFAQAVGRVASSLNYLPGTHGLPDVVVMSEHLERLAFSRYPASEEAIS